MEYREGSRPDAGGLSYPAYRYPVVSKSRYSARMYLLELKPLHNPVLQAQVQGVSLPPICLFNFGKTAARLRILSSKHGVSGNLLPLSVCAVCRYRKQSGTPAMPCSRKPGQRPHGNSGSHVSDLQAKPPWRSQDEFVRDVDGQCGLDEILFRRPAGVSRCACPGRIAGRSPPGRMDPPY